MFYPNESQYFEKNPIFPIEKFPSLVLSRNAFFLQNFFSNVNSITCQVAPYERLKTKENFRLLALKVVAAAYERWSLTRGSKYYLNMVILLGNFWCFGKLIAEERWSQPDRRFDCIPAVLINKHPECIYIYF